MLTTLSEAVKLYGDEKIKGEFVIIVEAKTEEELENERPQTDPVALARALMTDGMSLNEAAKQAAKETGAKKGDVYRALTAEKDG